MFRSLVISDYSRDIRYIYIPVHELLNLIRKLRPDGKMMTMFRDGSMTGFLGVLAPSVSIKDRSVVDSADLGLNCTSRLPRVGGSRNR